MIEMRLRLGREPPHDLAHVTAGFIDHPIDSAARSECTTSSCCPHSRCSLVVQSERYLAIVVEVIQPGTYQLLAGERALRLEHEEIVGVRDEISFERRGGLGDIAEVPDQRRLLDTRSGLIATSATGH